MWQEKPEADEGVRPFRGGFIELGHDWSRDRDGGGQRRSGLHQRADDAEGGDGERQETAAREVRALNCGRLGRGEEPFVFGAEHGKISVREQEGGRQKRGEGDERHKQRHENAGVNPENKGVGRQEHAG